MSPELERRLENIALQHHCTVEQLLSDFADRAEQTHLPPDPYRFLELSVALICIADTDGNLVYVNPAFCQTLGYDRDTLLSQPYITFIHPDDIHATTVAGDKLDAGADITQFENRYRCHDGSYRWLSWASVNVGEGYIYGVALDITRQKQLEQRLADSLEQNERILRTMFDGYLLGDLAGRILEVNTAYCEMIGYTADELSSMTVFELDAAIQDGEISQNAAEIVHNDVSMVIETKHRHKDGHLIDIEINSVKLDGGRIACFIRDISERKRLEEQIHRSVQLYRGMVESQTDFVCRYRPDTTLTYVNGSYCRFYNKSRDELVGNSFLMLAEETVYPQIFDRLRQVVENPTPDVRIYHTHNQDGSEQWIQWIDHGITDEQGAVVEIQAVGRDITPLIETQQRLAEREEMLSSIFKNIPVMLAQFNAQGEFEFVNQHWVNVLGWTAEEMRAHGDIMAEFYPDPEYRQTALDFMMSGETGWRDFKTRTRDGKILDTSWANVQFSDGRKLGIGQVITHRVELENQRIYAQKLELELEQERQLNEVKDRFVSIISHEFRTPLAVMTTSLGLVVDYFDRLSTERVLQKLAGVQQQVTRMVDLMEDALRFSKARAGKTEFVPEPVDIVSLCQNVIDTYRLVDDLAHPIILTGDGGIVHADPRLLEHILSNLLSNALKYSPEATPVAISLIRQQDQFLVKIQDKGVGIPETDLPKLFEPFHRASNIRELPGTGLGLSIVKDYIELHGGEIRVESVIGSGTTFVFTLPATARV